MGNLLFGIKENKKAIYYLVGDNLKDFLNKLKPFVEKINILKIGGATCFGDISNNWNEHNANDAKKLLSRAINLDENLIIKCYIEENHIKTGKCHISLQIMENEEQQVMLRGITNKQGKAIKLEWICKNYSDFKVSSLSGHYYDNELCGMLTTNFM